MKRLAIIFWLCASCCNAAWTKYKEIKYASAGIPTANLTDFPALVWIDTDADIASELSGGGGFKFTSADGSADLKFGLYPSTSAAAGTIHARVKLSPSSSASVGDVIARIYYSATGTTSEDKANTVSNSYVLFMPLEEDPSGSAPQMLDWVSNANVGTSGGSMTSGDLIAGVVGNCLDFDANDYLDITIPPALIGASAYTVQFAAKKSANSNTAVAISIRNGTSTSGLLLFYPYDSSTNGVRVYRSLQLTESGGGNRAGSWHQFALTPTAAFVDGVSEVTGTATSTSASATNVTIGAWHPSAQFFAGQIDEVKISTVTRTSDWLAYSYQVDFNKASLWALGSEQGSSGGNTTDFFKVLKHRPEPSYKRLLRDIEHTYALAP